MIEGAEIKAKTNLSAPAHGALPRPDIMISMLGDAQGNAPGGFLLLDEKFEIVGRWENDLGGMKFNYDFWYQPRHNVMVSQRMGGAEHLHAGLQPRGRRPAKYGREIHFWDFKKQARRADASTWARTG